MRRTMLGTAGAVMAVALAWAGAAGAQERKPAIAFINLDRCFNEYYKTRVADAQLKSQAKEFDEELKKLVADGEKLQKDFNALREESQNTALSEEVRAAKRNAAEEKVMGIREQETRIQGFRERRGKQLEEQSRRMRRGLVGEIREIVRTHAREKGYEAVLDSSGASLNGVESVLYVDPRNDITEEVVALLNKGAPANIPPPLQPPAKGDAAAKGEDGK